MVDKVKIGFYVGGAVILGTSLLLSRYVPQLDTASSREAAAYALGWSKAVGGGLLAGGLCIDVDHLLYPEYISKNRKDSSHR